MKSPALSFATKATPPLGGGKPGSDQDDHNDNRDFEALGTAPGSSLAGTSRAFPAAVLNRRAISNRIDSMNRLYVKRIRPFLAGQAFEPEIIREMSLALETVCGKLGMSSTDDPATRVAATRIIELARRGVLDAPTLTEMTLEELKHYLPYAACSRNKQR